jgi:Tol biopolymer transport system component
MFNNLFDGLTNKAASTRIVFERIGDRIAGFPTGIFTINPDGSDCQQIRSGSDHPSCPRWSPNGKWIAYPLWFSENRQHLICIVDLQSGQTEQLTYGDENLVLVWTPTNEIIFNQKDRLLVIDPDGQQHYEHPRFESEDSDFVWTYDGSKVAFRRGINFYVMNAEGGDFQSIPTHGRVPRLVISPDGQSVAYCSSDDVEPSGFEIFVLNLHGTGEKKKIVANRYDRERDKEVDSHEISWSPPL